MLWHRATTNQQSPPRWIGKKHWSGSHFSPDLTKRTRNVRSASGQASTIWDNIGAPLSEKLRQQCDASGQACHLFYPLPTRNPSLGFPRSCWARPQPIARIHGTLRFGAQRGQYGDLIIRLPLTEEMVVFVCVPMTFGRFMRDRRLQQSVVLPRVTVRNGTACRSGVSISSSLIAERFPVTIRSCRGHVWK